MISTILFDLYGTLLNFPQDSRPFLRLAERAKEGELRTALERCLITDNPTLTDFASLIRLEPQEDLAELETQLAKDLARVAPFAETLSTLTELKSQGIRIAVISNLATPYKAPFFTHQLDEFSELTLLSCDVGLVKPNPAIYQMALDQLGVCAEETLMVGDSFRSDVEGPAQLGIRGVHLVRKYPPPSHGGEFISSLATLPSLIA